MNYKDHEELRLDIEQLNNEMNELFQKIKSLEKKYRWNSQDLTQNMAGQILRIAANELSHVHTKIYEMDLIFSD
ncbi:hypothetical protein DLP14_14645 [Salmonella enterica]|nr:hypothetical protein [Salmonella enterica]EMD7797640.1 hypothetical protein [Salmonella enterica]